MFSFLSFLSLRLSLPLPTQGLNPASAPSLVTWYDTLSCLALQADLPKCPAAVISQRPEPSSARTDLPTVNLVSKSQFPQDIPIYTCCSRVTHAIHFQKHSSVKGHLPAAPLAGLVSCIPVAESRAHISGLQFQAGPDSTFPASQHRLENLVT